MSGKKLTRREFLGLSTMAGAGAVLTATGAAGALAVAEAAAAATAPAAATALAGAATAVDLRFVWWGGQQRSDVTTKVIKMFETQHPNVKFAFEPLGFDDSWTKMTTRAPSVSNIPAVLRTHGMIDGKIYGLSTGINAGHFAVDMDSFKKAGIEVPANSWSSTDFANVVAQLHTKLGVWGFGTFLNHRILSVVSLGECSCAACAAKRRYELNRIPRQPTVLQQYHQRAA